MDTQTLKTTQSNDGTRIAYDQQGNGPVVILVAAALSTRAETTQLAGLLAERFTVINYDRRGRGNSGDNLTGGGSTSVQREVEDIAALINAASGAAAGGKAALFGHSSGAVLALEAANRLPDKVTKLALFEPPFVIDSSRPPVPADFASHMQGLVSAGRRGDAVAYFMTKGVGVPEEFLGEMKNSPMWPEMEALAHTLPYDGAIMAGLQQGNPLPAARWSAVTAPALVMAGGNSPEFMHNGAQALAALLPKAQYRKLDGLDHGAAVMAPDALAPVLVEFLKG